MIALVKRSGLARNASLTHEANEWMLWVQHMPQSKYRVKGVDRSSGVACKRYMLDIQVLQELADQI